MAVTGLQVFWPGIYWRGTRVGVAGALASDLLDLSLILPLLAATTVLAVRGSLSALLVWTGTLGFLTYNFVIYGFAVHFNAMFPAYCAVLGLSFYGLVGVREFLAPDEVARRYTLGASPQAAWRRTTAVTLFVLSAIPAAMELKEIGTAINAGQMPASVTEAGQLTNPIHVLDLCFFLPLVVTAAIQLLRRKAIGFMLAAPLMVTMILISLEVLTITAVFRARGLPTDPAPVIFFAAASASLTALVIWFLRSAGEVNPAGDVRL